MQVVGITGTCGKTTTAFLVESILSHAGKNVGLIGTVCNRVEGRLFPSAYTTPPADELHAILTEMRGMNVDAVAIEISSHGLAERRVDEVQFDAAVFLNLSHDHLRFHRTMDAYFDAKARLFWELLPQSRKRKRTAVVNADDPRVGPLIDQIPGGVEVIRFSVQPNSDANVRLVEADLRATGVQAKIVAFGEPMQIDSRLLGRHNLHNVLAATATALSLGVDGSLVRAAIASATPPAGRLELVEGAPRVYIDMAHTPAALEAGLVTLHQIRGPEQARIITVVGCGGERDHQKRPRMAAIAAKSSDLVILTSDNPRSEVAQNIASDMMRGIHRPSNVKIELDREEAIRLALGCASSSDIVLIAGKGHECAQVFADCARFFSDRFVVLRERQRSGRSSPKTVHIAAPPLVFPRTLGDVATYFNASIDPSWARIQLETAAVVPSVVGTHTLVIPDPFEPLCRLQTFMRRALELRAAAVMVPQELAEWNRLYDPIPGLPAVAVGDIFSAARLARTITGLSP